MNLSDNIKKIRKENNLSQEQLAEKLGVSRQSVSKWESGQAYPEMDKVLQICDLFNLNMDDLMKSDLKEVRETKQNKTKYVDDFFDYITKTIDMFTSLKFIDKIKCLLEQVFIGACLFIICFILNELFSEIFWKIFGFNNSDVYYILYNVFQAIYLVIAFFVSLAVFLHIFKIRFLDYYVFVKEESKESKEIIELPQSETNKKDDKVKVELSKKQEKIVIRDPNHSGYKFLNGMIKCALFFIKSIVFFIGISLVLTLLAFSFTLVIPFLFINAGFLFWGALLCIISCIIINLVILSILYNFITSKKTKRSLIGKIIAFCIIILGIGSGIFTIGLTNISFNDILTKEETTTHKIELEMQDNLVLNINRYKTEIEYIESLNENVIVEFTHSKYLSTHMYSSYEDEVEIVTYIDKYKIFDLIKAYINDLNDYEIKDHGVIKAKIYTTKENMVKLKENSDKRNNVDYIHQKEIQDLHNYYEQIIHDYQKQISELNDRNNYLDFDC